MSRLYLLLTLCSCTFIAYSQHKFSLSGTVTDSKGNPIENVHVSVDGTSLGSGTDATGSFTINSLAKGQYSLSISHLGYLTHAETVTVPVNSPLAIVIIEDIHLLPQLYVIDKRDQLFTKTPGSVSYLGKEELSRLVPISGNEVFRRIPGLNVVDEEGAGLRVNIGIRGLDPDRSRNILMLEDGIPVALNPYGEPEMYYTPAIDRMSGVEVVKGSGQILYGPQTVGGVINYITADPPEKQSIRVRMQGGKGGYLSALGSYGNTFNNTGIQVNFLHKEADALGSTNFNVNDFTSKLKIAVSNRATLGVKLAAYNETSSSTYVGITQRMYDTGGNDYSVLVPNDELAIKRYLMSFSHTLRFNENLNLQSSLYGYTTTRNWRRQDYSYNTYTSGNLNPPPSDWTGVMWGDESVAGGAIYLRNRTGNRNRQFEVLGWEQKINYAFLLGGIQNNLISGYRLLYERAYEQRINGTSATAKSGALVSDEIRTGNAFAFYLLDKITLTNKLEISPGIRTEIYSYERAILRQSSQDVDNKAENTINEVIPGIGLNFRPTSSLNIFSGIHRGYAPPRIKDAIDFSVSNPVLNLKAESSWNIELGMRAQLIKGMFAEVTYFYMDFDNQIIPSSQSIGGSGFGVTNAGRTLHRGVETSLSINSRELANTGLLVLLDVNATFTRARYNSDRLVSNGTENINVFGNRLPYAPELTTSTALSIETIKGTGLRITHTYVGNQFTDELNTLIPSNNGRIGRMPSYALLDFSFYQQVPALRATFNLSVKNVTDERYIATRRPEGIRVGLPRLITAGFEFKL